MLLAALSVLVGMVLAVLISTHPARCPKRYRAAPYDPLKGYGAIFVQSNTPAVGGGESTS